MTAANPPPTVLFIGHSAGRTGAPILMLNLVRWLKNNTDYGIEILLREGGDLVESFEELGPTTVVELPRAREGRWARLVYRLRRAAAERKYWAAILRRYQSKRISLVYSNTITNGQLLALLEPLDCPVISHVHELQFWIEHSGKENLEQVRAHTHTYIAASEAVKRNLVENSAIEDHRIHVIHEFIPDTPHVSADVGPQVRRRLGVPDEAFLVIGSGEESWRKGKDLFVLLASMVLRENDPEAFHFVWIGGWDTPYQQAAIRHDISLLGVEDRVQFIGKVDNPLDYFAAADVFVMVSREDPFPLVCLEAASLGQPVLCFDQAGGMPEFVRQDAGYVVPYLDLEGMADRIVHLRDHPDERRSLGLRGAARVREHHTVEVSAPRILDVIRQVLTAARRGATSP